ncbi:aldo/keto reductase [Salinarchaeum chitinilyticum]
MTNAPTPIGFGTWQNEDPEQCAESVRTAVEAGYRHVDTAQGYDNEAAVGDGIAAADVDREDVFLATKVDTGDLGYDDVLRTTEESLEKLGVDTIDLLYVHWPLDTYDPDGTLSAFDELVDRGAIRHVGLSNFTPEQLAEAREILDAPIFAHQVECHPYCQQEEHLALAEEHDYHLVAYSPLAQTEVFDDPVIQDVAEEHDASPAQVCLAWLRQRGAVAIPKATSREHVLDNYESLGVELSDDAMERIDSIEEEYRVVDFDGAPWDLA